MELSITESWHEWQWSSASWPQTFRLALVITRDTPRWCWSSYWKNNSCMAALNKWQFLLKNFEMVKPPCILSGLGFGCKVFSVPPEKCWRFHAIIWAWTFPKQHASSGCLQGAGSPIPAPVPQLWGGCKERGKEKNGNKDMEHREDKWQERTFLIKYILFQTSASI